MKKFLPEICLTLGLTCAAAVVYAQQYEKYKEASTKVYEEAYWVGYRDSIIATYYNNNEYIIDNKSFQDTAILYKKDQLLPNAHQGVEVNHISNNNQQPQKKTK